MSIGGPKPSAFYLERQLATRLPTTPAAPSGLDSVHAFGQNDPGPGNPTPGDGLILSNIMAITVSIYPQNGFTLTGGTLQCWMYNVFQQAWTRQPGGDLTVVAGTYTGPVGYTFNAVMNPNRMGSIVNFLANSLTGTSPDFLVRTDGFNSVLGMSTSG